MSPFEQKLAGLSRHEIPSEWRGQILGTAGLRPMDQRATEGSRRHRLISLLPFPHPAAWAALAAAWIVIVILNLSGPRGEELYAVTPKEFRGRLPTTQEYLVYAEWQRQLLLTLADEPAFVLERRTIPHPRNL